MGSDVVLVAGSLSFHRKLVSGLLANGSGEDLLSFSSGEFGSLFSVTAGLDERRIGSWSKRLDFVAG